MKYDHVNLVVALVSALIIGLLLGSYAARYDVKTSSAEEGGFKIGHGVLMQEWRCYEVTTHSTLEDAKAKVIEYQERVK